MSENQFEVTVITATNLDPKYLDCVPLYIQFWLDQSSSSKNTYTPLVIVVAKQIPDELEEYSKYCVLHVPIEGVSDVFVSQFIRSLYAPLCSGDLIITSDVDMLPISTMLFDEIIASRKEDLPSFDICRDVLGVGQYPICYNLATPGTWGIVVGVKDIADVDKRVIDSYNYSVKKNNGYVSSHGGKGWFSDQEFIYTSVEAYEVHGGSVRKFSDSQTKHSRLDRLYLPFPINWLALPWVYFGTFTDYHVHHPARKFRIFIDSVRSINRFKNKRNKGQN